MSPRTRPARPYWLAAAALVAGPGLALVSSRSAPAPGWAERAWIDVDGDRALDLFAVDAAGRPVLYRTTPDGPVDVTSGSGLGDLRLQLASWEDWDRDGDLDLLAIVDGRSTLFTNDDGVFGPEAAWLGVQQAGLDLDASWLDQDADGRPDVEVVQADRTLVYRNGPEGFAVTELALPAALPAPGSVDADSDETAGGAPAVGGAPSAGPGRTAFRRGRADRPRIRSSAASGPPPTVDWTGSALGGGPGAILPCASAVADFAGGSCIDASSVPAIGKLYPLSKSFFVGPSGDVGLGTTSPASELHVSGGNQSATLTISADDDNSNELDQPQLRLTQDGGAVVGTVGFLDGSNDLSLFNEFGASRVKIDSAGQVTVFEENLQLATLELDPDEHGGGQFVTYSTTGETMTALDTDIVGGGGRLRMWNAGQVTPLVLMVAREQGVQGAALFLRKATGVSTIEADAEFGDGGGGRLFVRDAGGLDAITLDGAIGRTYTKSLQITGGSDIAEPFDVAGDPEPGMLVSIDPETAGGLRVADRAYDTGIVGVVSGAGGIQPGLTLTQEGTIADGAHPVALSGRVWCLADASAGPIAPGDLLTSSATPGHAMRAEAGERAFGAVVGKAMTGLAEGRGQVLVWVNLQ